jgi:hypothetical protein
MFVYTVKDLVGLGILGVLVLMIVLALLLRGLVWVADVIERWWRRRDARR